jgi:tetratricopeptide (TPR) repeat protein/nitrate/TMAO reductase-like tetraheme cytochrome c subunit
MKLPKWRFILFLLLLVNTAYIWAHATASVFYMANVLLHVFGGLAVLLLCRKYLSGAARVLFLFATLCAAFLIWKGALTEYRWVLYAHIALAAAATIWFAFRVERRLFFGLALMAVWPAAVRIYPDPGAKIKNPLVVPASMQEEGGGPNSPFWPSSAKTDVGGTIPSNFFMDSKLCGECHKDIYEQWNSSTHHFASFNNQFYRKSIEQMQELSGTKGSKWCAGCHDHAVFFNGRFDKPMKDQIDTPEAQTGLGCMSCHSIVHVEGTMGNGGFTIEYPPLHDLASSRNRYIRLMDTFLTYLNPEPHRRAFLKPFMKSSSEFCSSCHKVHLDVPVNNYRWIRGFNDYDNWQASGVSGEGARSFYYPAQSATCSDCHMPLTASHDPGHRNGKIHNHRFAAANMAVAYANRDEEQMKATEKFLKSGFITVDIFAASPVESNGPLEMKRRAGDAQQAMSTFAVGEEAEQTGQVVLRDVGKVSAPIDQARTTIKPGDSVRVDVVVRTRKIGHFFPGGTVDSFDVWLELEARDASGRLIYLSGAVEENGRGPVEKGAHFYRSYSLDGDGNMIDKRNAWQARSVLYVRLIPPGAADVAHYRVRVPKDAKGPISLRARLNYRKFSHYYTQYAYAGEPTGGSAGLDHDSREYSFKKTNIPKNVSGKIKDEIPDLPIVTLAEASAKIAVGDGMKWDAFVGKVDRERWNDWGIGLLLQGDLKAAEYAFKKVTEAEPEYADGWLNVARALIQEGEIEAAKPYLEKAMKLNPNLGRVHFFLAMVRKADGDYDGAIASLRRVEAMYPRDRVVLNQLGRVLFLQRKYAEAVTMLQRVLSIDPEDVQAHYTLMLCYRGLGKPEQAAREEQLFRRFKADESAQSITQKPRMLNPEDNNERQPIHDHESVVLK